MAYVRQVDPDDAEGHVKAQYDAGLKRAGKIFNILRIQSLTPEALEATMHFYVQVMHGKGPLRRWVRELLATVVSKINGCVY
ncbi:MAG: carboxymuconolactone decarboxylase family protein [Planctomycetes bacterium]|nr:carboxymuconolactone decarboxylase family protein [Planctomycetota bacterium]